MANFNKPLFIFKKFLGQNDRNLLSKETKHINLGMLKKPIGPMDTELWFDLIYSLINIKKIRNRKKTDWLQSTIGPTPAMLLLFVH